MGDINKLPQWAQSQINDVGEELSAAKAEIERLGVLHIEAHKLWGADKIRERDYHDNLKAIERILLQLLTDPDDVYTDDDDIDAMKKLLTMIWSS